VIPTGKSSPTTARRLSLEERVRVDAHGREGSSDLKAHKAVKAARGDVCPLLFVGSVPTAGVRALVSIRCWRDVVIVRCPWRQGASVLCSLEPFTGWPEVDGSVSGCPACGLGFRLVAGGADGAAGGRGRRNPAKAIRKAANEIYDPTRNAVLYP
jgi:hypothetical protein